MTTNFDLFSIASHLLLSSLRQPGSIVVSYIEYQLNSFALTPSSCAGVMWHGQFNLKSLSESKLSPCYDLVLDYLVQGDKIGTETGYPHNKIAVFLWMKLGISQHVGAYTVEL